MDLSALRDRVKTRVRIVSAVPFSDEEIDTAINDGYAELSDATEWRDRVATITLLERRPYYDARTVLTDDVLSIGRAFNVTTQRWLEPVSAGQLDRRDVRWEQYVMTPCAVLTHGLWWFGYAPRASADADDATIQQHYTALPDRLDDDDDQPELPERFHDGLVEFAVYDLLCQIGETAQAIIAWSKYLAEETSVIQWVASRNAGVLHVLG